MQIRKDWDTYFLDIAFQVAERSTCPRRKVGAVIVKDRRIKGTGYNGSAAKLPHCQEEGCLIVNGHCLRTIHAEVNALLECTPEERQGATIYITDRPCAECSKLIISTGITRVVFAREYPPDFDWFGKAPWVKVIHLPRGSFSSAAKNEKQDSSLVSKYLSAIADKKGKPVGQQKTITLPRLDNLTPTMESTALKLMEEAGELAQAIGKLRGLSGEKVQLDAASVQASITCELLDVAQTAVSLMFVLEDQYGIDIRQALEAHIAKLRAKGYLK